MWIGVGLTPVADVAAVVDGAVAAEEDGLDAVALWDRCQSGRPEWARRAGASADEVNVYPDVDLVAATREARTGTAPKPVSIHADRSWDNRPTDPPAALEALHRLGVDGAFIAIGAANMPGRIATLSRAARASGIIGA